MHAVEHVAGGIGGRIPGDDADGDEGFLGYGSDGSFHDGACREFFRSHYQMIDGFHRQAAAGRGECQRGSIRGFRVGEVCGASFVAPCGGLEGVGGDEEATGCERLDGGGNAGFQPVVKIGDGQGEPGGVDCREHVGEHRQGESLEAEPDEQLTGGGEVKDGDGDVHFGVIG
jgi:hypothetical protein